MFERYAIFYTPPPGAFADFGASWLGWDSAAGCEVAHPAGLDTDLIKQPQKYGFHATLKAPFYLAAVQDEAALIAAADDFAAVRASVALAGLSVQSMGSFVALRPVEPSAELQGLAKSVVQGFDTFRAPLTDGYITRRRRTGLTPRQDAQMLDWGYPYVFDDFRFHMTLSGPVDEVTATDLAARVQPLVTPNLPDPMIIDAISVMGEDEDGMFHLLHRATLNG